MEDAECLESTLKDDTHPDTDPTTSNPTESQLTSETKLNLTEQKEIPDIDDEEFLLRWEDGDEPSNMSGQDVEKEFLEYQCNSPNKIDLEVIDDKSDVKSVIEVDSKTTDENTLDDSLKDVDQDSINTDIVNIDLDEDSSNMEAINEVMKDEKRIEELLNTPEESNDVPITPIAESDTTITNLNEDELILDKNNSEIDNNTEGNEKIEISSENLEENVINESTEFNLNIEPVLESEMTSEITKITSSEINTETEVYSENITPIDVIEPQNIDNINSPIEHDTEDSNPDKIVEVKPDENNIKTDKHTDTLLSEIINENSLTASNVKCNVEDITESNIEEVNKNTAKNEIVDEILEYSTRESKDDIATKENVTSSDCTQEVLTDNSGVKKSSNVSIDDQITSAFENSSQMVLDNVCEQSDIQKQIDCKEQTVLQDTETVNEVKCDQIEEAMDVDDDLIKESKQINDDDDLLNEETEPAISIEAKIDDLTSRDDVKDQTTKDVLETVSDSAPKEINKVGETEDCVKNQDEPMAVDENDTIPGKIVTNDEITNKKDKDIRKSDEDQVADKITDEIQLETINEPIDITKDVLDEVEISAQIYEESKKCNLNKTDEESNNKPSETVESGIAEKDVSNENITETNIDTETIESETSNIINDKELEINKSIENEGLTKADDSAIEMNTDETCKDTENKDITDTRSDKEDSKLIPVNIEHGLYQPNAMLEIPTQELIDIDDTDSQTASDDGNETLNITQEINNRLETDVASNKFEGPKSAVENLEDDVDNSSAEVDSKTHDESRKLNDKNENSKDLCTEQNSDVKVDDTKNDPKTIKEVPKLVDTTDNIIESPKIIDDKIDTESKMDVDSEIDSIKDFLVEASKTFEPQPSTSKAIFDSINSESKTDVTNLDLPSTSKVQESFDSKESELSEVNDSLGLLAESSRVQEDDYQDDDDDFDNDESSNQMTAYNSEDSNHHHSDQETAKKETADITKESEKDGAIEMDVLCEEDANEIETVKLSDTSDNESEQKNETELKEDENIKEIPSPTKQSPSKTKKIEISKTQDENIVEVNESSSEDDVLTEKAEIIPLPNKEGMTSVNIPKSIEIMSSGGCVISELIAKEGEIIINGVPKPTPQRTARLNTDEVTIKTAVATEPTLVIPEAKLQVKKDMQAGSEVVNLDSDDETKNESKSESGRCINPACNSKEIANIIADRTCILHYCAKKNKNLYICRPCYEVVLRRTESFVNGLKNFTPFFELDMAKPSVNLVEISDSDSEDDATVSEKTEEIVGEVGAKLLEDNLVDLINETWMKYKMNSRMNEAKTFVEQEVDKLEKQSKEIEQMMNECQAATDKIRESLYKTFEPNRHELAPIHITDILGNYQEMTEVILEEEKKRLNKRRLSDASKQANKKRAVAIPYANNEEKISQDKIVPETISSDLNKDDDKDISVVQLSAEIAPPDLPPPGELIRPPLKPGMYVWAMRNVFSPWVKVKIQDVLPKTPNSIYTVCSLKFEMKTKNPIRVQNARCLAHLEPPNARLTIGTRIIALFKNSHAKSKVENYYSGVVAEIPNPVNNYRYLVFFDDGYAQYVAHPDTRLVCEYSNLVWEEVHAYSREFVKQYLLSYPERPMVRLHAGQSLKTEWNGKWWMSTILKVDASLAQVHFQKINRTEWIYRGSTRLAPLFLELQAAERQRTRPLPRSMAQARSNMPYVEYTRSDEQIKSKQDTHDISNDIRKQRAVAKKSTVHQQSISQPNEQPGNLDSVISRVVYYTPKKAVKPHKLAPHTCNPRCKRNDTLSLKDLRTYNPLAKPLLSGWERQIVRYKGVRDVMYRAPCGRRIRDVRELHRYLSVTGSDMPVDLFDFNPATHCLAEFVIHKFIVGKKDLSHGKENVPVPCVNYYDESLPEFCSYNTERTPTAGVPLNLDPAFLCGCDCTNDCEDKSKCACWKMTLEGARTIGLDGTNVGYDYKRLLEPLPSGIYECNSRCKCKQTCLNRVAQHPLQLKLQVFKTLNRGWGIRALNDVPKGAFLCVYAGNLLTDATANLDGLNEGDEYLAELDYIEVVEQMKEGYEEDLSEADKKLGKEGSKNTSSDEDEEPSSDEADDEKTSKDEVDDDFQPGYCELAVTKFSKRLRQREKKKEEEKEKTVKEKEKPKDNVTDDCITISDDEDNMREPSRFTAQTGMGANEFVPKHRSVRDLYGEDEACYIMDAKVQGNIGRYLNHSCSPNVFVQNVFVDTHDPRFPWVAFFALSHIRAGTELTWNYNYDVGSVPGKVLYCHCGAPNCRGRLL